MLKTYCLLSLLVFTLLSCSQTGREKNGEVDGSLVQNPATLTSDSSNRKVPEMSFGDTRHDFGKIKEGDKVTYEFRFTNTGNAPLLISNVKASCGCTTPDWPRNLIQPGDSNVIKVEYNSKGRVGEFSKAVEITANTYPNNTTLTISGVVFKD